MVNNRRWKKNELQELQKERLSRGSKVRNLKCILSHQIKMVFICVDVSQRWWNKTLDSSRTFQLGRQGRTPVIAPPGEERLNVGALREHSWNTGGEVSGLCKIQYHCQQHRWLELLFFNVRKKKRERKCLNGKRATIAADYTGFSQSIASQCVQGRLNTLIIPLGSLHVWQTVSLLLLKGG